MATVTYKRIAVGTDKVMADAAIRDGTGKRIDTNYQPKLVSGTNIKTINNQSILGSGNIAISGGGSKWTAVDQYDIMNHIQYGSNIGDELIGNYITFSGASFLEIMDFHFIWTGIKWVGSGIIQINNISPVQCGVVTSMSIVYDESTGDPYLFTQYQTGTTYSGTGGDYFYSISVTAMSGVYYREGEGE